MNHPLHPLFTHLPIGLWIVSFVFDICFLASANPMFAQASWYCMLIGLIGAGLAAITGLADYVDIPRSSLPRRVATVHMIMNFAITGLYFFNLVNRHEMSGSVPTLVSRGQFFLSLLSIFLLSVSGYLGGLLVYNYGIGFKPQLRDRDKTDTEDQIRRAA